MATILQIYKTSTYFINLFLLINQLLIFHVLLVYQKCKNYNYFYHFTIIIH
jgi:hypothetical protein